MSDITARRGKQDLFFPVIATLMVLIAFVGFSRTFYLRAFTGVEDPVTGGALPLLVVLHGLVLSLWVIIFCVQSWLVFTRRIGIHRTMGYAGLVTGISVFVFGIATLIYWVPRVIAMNEPPVVIAGLFTGNIIALLSFLVFLALAYFWRRKPENHRRMMYFATVSIIGPALASGRPLGGFLAGFFPMPGMVVPIAFVVLLLAYDFLRDGRLHAVSLWAGFAVVVKYPVRFVFLAPNEFIQAAVLSLG